jgi:hypothetical protein
MQKSDTRPSGPPERDPEHAPDRDDVRVDGSPVRCPFCHESVDVGQDDWVACAGCLARHHGECWTEGGRCGACKATEPLRRDAPAVAAPLAPPAATPPDVAPGVRTFTRTIPGEVGDEVDEVVVGEARSRLGTEGRFERLGRTLTWTSSVTPGPGVTVSVASRDGATTLTVRDVAPVKDLLHPAIAGLLVLMLALLASLVGIATGDILRSSPAGLAAGLLAFVPLIYLFIFKFVPEVRRGRAESAAKVDALAAALEQELRSRARPLKPPVGKGE